MGMLGMQAAVHSYQIKLRHSPETTWVTPDAHCLLEGYCERAITLSFIVVHRDHALGQHFRDGGDQLVDDKALDREQSEVLRARVLAPPLSESPF
jgi:hypothetical protein